MNASQTIAHITSPQNNHPILTHPSQNSTSNPRLRKKEPSPADSSASSFKTRAELRAQCAAQGSTGAGHGPLCASSKPGGENRQEQPNSESADGGHRRRPGKIRLSPGGPRIAIQRRPSRDASRESSINTTMGIMRKRPPAGPRQLFNYTISRAARRPS